MLGGAVISMKKGIRHVAIHRLIIAGCIASLGFSVSTALAQGPLAPPGAPAPTMRSLAQIEGRTPISTMPFTVSAPGSYYLTTNFTGSATITNAIVILADNVTLDLNGFILAGPSASAGSAISVPGVQRRLVVRNGIIRGWNGSGLNASNAYNCLVEDVEVAECQNDGISVGPQSLVRNSLAISNALQVVTSAGSGIAAGDGSTVVDCVAMNTVRGVGVSVGVGSIVENVTANNNGVGNPNAGIVAQDGSSIHNCTVRGNNTDGIRVTSGCLVIGNSVLRNSSAGIAVVGSYNRIDGNSLPTNTLFGIVTTASGNVIVRNNAAGNGTNNYCMVAGNDLGPVGIASSASSPWSNISH